MHSISVSTEIVKFQKRVNLHLFSLQIFTICLLCQEVSIAAALRNLLQDSTRDPLFHDAFPGTQIRTRSTSPRSCALGSWTSTLHIPCGVIVGLLRQAVHAAAPVGEVQMEHISQRPWTKNCNNDDGDSKAVDDGIMKTNVIPFSRSMACLCHSAPTPWVFLHASVLRGARLVPERMPTWQQDVSFLPGAAASDLYHPA